MQNKRYNLNCVHDNKKFFEMLQKEDNPSSILNTFDVNVIDNDGRSLLHYAARVGDLRIIKILIKNFNANIDIINKDEQTPLLQAALNGHEDIVEYLIKNNANIWLQCNMGRNLLHYAAHYGRINVINTIFEFTTPGLWEKLINSKDYDGKAPLHCAALQQDPNVIRLLIKLGAIAELKNNYNYTPLHIASARNPNVEITLELINAGAKLNTLNINGESPIILSARFRNLNITKTLLSIELEQYKLKIDEKVIQSLEEANNKFFEDKETCFNYYHRSLTLAAEKNSLVGVVY